jgi:alpha-L-rhamnosidase
MGLRNGEGSAGFRTFVLQPYFPAGINTCRMSHTSLYGAIVSDWKREGEKITWHVYVPVNTETTLFFPEGAKDIIENGDGSVKKVVQGSSGLCYEKSGSGDHIFEFSLNAD